MYCLLYGVKYMVMEHECLGMAQNSLTDDDIEELQTILETNRKCGTNAYTASDSDE